jgi:hypothetical protein
MTPEARNWMMRWTVMGRPTTLPLSMLATLPREAVMAQYDDPALRLEAHDDRGAYEFLRFEAHGREGRHYKLEWPILEGGYDACIEEPTPHGIDRRTYSSRGSFETVTRDIRKWIRKLDDA